VTPLDRYDYIVRALRLQGVPKSVLVVIHNHADADGTCFLLQSTIAAESGFSARAIRNAIKFLSIHGLIIVRRHGHKASTFQLTLESFQLAASKKERQPAPRAERNRHLVPTEVAPMKVRPRKPRKTSPEPHAQHSANLNVIPFPPAEDPRPICKCGLHRGDGDTCPLCIAHRESDQGVRDVVPDFKP